MASGPLPTLIFFLTVERFQIKNADGIFAAIAGKSPAKPRGKRHAVNTGRIGNFADLLACRCINHHDTRGARDEQPMSLAIRCKVVPAAVAAELPGFDDSVIPAGRTSSGGRKGRA